MGKDDKSFEMLYESYGEVIEECDALRSSLAIVEEALSRIANAKSPHTAGPWAAAVAQEALLCLHPQEARPESFVVQVESGIRTVYDNPPQEASQKGGRR